MSDKSKANKPPVAVPSWKNRTFLLGIAVVLIAGIAYARMHFLEENRYPGVPKRAIDNYEKGVEALEKNDPEKALRSLLDAVELDQTFADAHGRIAEAYFMAGMKHKSANNTAMKTNMLEQSLTFVNKALALDSENGYAHFVLGYHAYEKKNLDEAIRELELARSAGVHSFELHSMLAYMYNQKEETAKCIEEYQMALELRPTDIKTLYNLGELFFGIENFKKSTFYYGELLKYDPEDYDSRANYAASFWKDGDRTKAKELFSQMLVSPGTDKFRVHNTVAWVLIERDVDVKWGIEIAQIANDLKPNNIESVNILGWGYFKNKDYANAVKYLNMSMNMSPSDEVKRRLTLAKEKLDEAGRR